MKKFILIIMFVVMFITPTAIAGVEKQISSGEDYRQAKYTSEFVEYTVVEVATQYESGAHEIKFQCIDNGNEILDLEGLPSDFKEKYERKLKSIMKRFKSVEDRLMASQSELNPGKEKKLRRKMKKIMRKAKRGAKAKLRASNFYRSQDKIILTDGSNLSITEDAESIDAAVAEAEGGVAVENAESDNLTTVLVVHITAADTKTSATPEQLSDSVFGTDGDLVNLASQYDACSYGTKMFVPAEGPNIVNGVVQITIPNNVVGTSSNTIMNAVTAAGNKLFGDLGLGDISNQAEHVMYAIPSGTSDGWIAYAYVNHWLSVYNNQWATYVSAQMHEVGHNLELAHSGEGTAAYADQSGMMGYSYGQDEGPVMCFNSAKSAKLGWYDDKKVTITGSWTGKLIGLADFADAADDQTVILHIENGQISGKGVLNITYNRKKGINSGTLEGGNQVMVVGTSATTGYQKSLLLSKLSKGGTYTFPDFGGAGKDFTITVDDIVTDGNDVQYAMVSVVYGQPQENLYALTVNSGSGAGNYTSGTKVTIKANAATSGKVFDKWVVNSGTPSIDNINASSTTLTMPSSAATVTATYKTIATGGPAGYTWCANEGGAYTFNQTVDVAYGANGQFAYKRGVTGAINFNNATFGDPIPGVGKAGYYKVVSAPAEYSLTVNNGTGDGNYTSGQVVNIRANTPPSGQVFDRWTVVSGNPAIGSITASSTTLTMPASAATITATYENLPPVTYALTVENGSGDGNYEAGTVVTITADEPESVGPVTTPLSYSESFENTLGDWTQGNADNTNWTIKSGSTPSSSTGPSSAADGSYYVYIEASRPNYPNKVANLVSGNFDFSGNTNLQVNFKYHMYGSYMGTLNLQASTDGNTWSTLWTKSGDQGNSWQLATVSLSSYEGNASVQLRFNGTTGSGYRSDMAVDHFEISGDSVTTGKVFDKWVVNSGSPSIANVTASSTTLTMPGRAATVTATYKTLPTGGPAGYTWCANEGDSYTFNQTVDVAYGANGRFVYRSGVTGSITFNNGTFGDPIGGVRKAGYYKAAATINTGKITRQVWSGISGTSIVSLTDNSNYPNNPSTTNQLTSFEAPTNWADNYGTRIVGYLHPQVSGTYTFWIAADDNAELWLSTNDTSGSKQRIAYVPGWSNSRQWTKYAQQKSVGISLIAGQHYFIEALQKEAGGGDNLAVAWQRPGGSQEVIPGAYLSPF